MVQVVLGKRIERGSRNPVSRVTLLPDKRDQYAVGDRISVRIRVDGLTEDLL